ncbi:MAG: dihydropteroate synthase [Treponema sp.]|nr:dihydropteroate synthase [Treponema sp.]
MGIVNVTPDSFWSGSRGGAERAFQLIDEGADILDIGGESTRPGSSYLSAAEECERIVPVIAAVRARSSIPISVDTRKLSVLQAARQAGADILNDVSALEDDQAIGVYAAQEHIPVILMHKRGIPAIMQQNTRYDEIVKDVDAYLQRRAAYAQACGIAQDKIIVDPGIGFGKDGAGNRALIQQCGTLCGGRYPVLMALSRKSCIGELTGRPVDGRLAGTLAANLCAVQRGASFLRVHDVAETRDALSVMSALL